ncbi:flagellar protein FliT [Pseudomonas sp. dw_358]|uniref:flagellar protein FliT n=1 Tax=Pseudomonas sp. dw_358 TaxID=2720083 RepID=UPI001BD30E61|nr:flagellar protein FliT [Pseudomonas sp. dw_358]
MSALQRIEQTRDALVDAMAAEDWQAIGTLDIECRACVESVLESGAAVDEAQLRANLEDLLGVYRKLLEVTTGARQAIVEEMKQVSHAHNAAKVYQLFR